MSFICCGGFRKKKPTLPDIFDGNEPAKDEPFDYFVEKLTIRKIPLRLFATKTEPLEIRKRNEATSSDFTEITQIIDKPKQPPVEEQRPSVTFSSYCKISNNDKKDKPIEKNISEDQESLLVAEILNKHSSLFTLDTKEAVPKDPDHPPKSSVVVPSRVRSILSKSEMFPPLNKSQANFATYEVKVDVHKADEEPARPPPPSNKRDPSPALKRTINELGRAQKPHIPGFPPKNQRCVFRSVMQDEEEREISSNVLEPEELSQGTCLLLDPNSKYSEQGPSGSNNRSCNRHNCRYLEEYTTSINLDSDEKTMAFADSKKVPTVKQGNVGEKYKWKSNLIEEQEDDDSTNFDSRRKLRRNSSEQTKGQSLKWKIIIKHHSDKKKQLSPASSKSDTMDTESDDK